MLERWHSCRKRRCLQGSSEIRNWITVVGMIPHLSCDFAEYMPVHRTPAGTGIGLGFMSWT